jgi:hypothetical protein
MIEGQRSCYGRKGWGVGLGVALLTSCASVNWSLTTVGHCTLPRWRRPLSSAAPRAADALGAALRLFARQA